MLIIGYLFDKLDSDNLTDITDVIIVSDHGHTKLGPQNATCISIYDYVDPEDVHMLVIAGPVFELEPKQGKLQKVIVQR